MKRPGQRPSQPLQRRNAEGLEPSGSGVLRSLQSRWSRSAWPIRHQQGLAYETFGLEEVQARVHGDAALVTASQTARGTYRGNPTPEAVRATLALVKQGGRWRMAGIHMSFIAGTPGAPPIPGTPAPTSSGRT